MLERIRFDGHITNHLEKKDSQGVVFSIFQGSKSISDRFIKLSLENCEFFSSQKEAVIALIEKKDRDKQILKNWRPISLIKVDVEIASKALHKDNLSSQIKLLT